MPACDAERYIAMAIGDVLASDFEDFELIVIDDGSTDGTARIAASFADPRVRIVLNDGNIGLTPSLNKGLELARGKFIARMDADDRMRPDRFTKQVAALDSDEGLALISSFVDQINADGEVTGTWATDRACASEPEIRAMLPRTNCIAHSTVMLRRDALTGLRYAGPNEDWDLWLRLLARGRRMAKLPEALVQLRITPGSFMGEMRKRASLDLRLLRSRWSFLFRELRVGRFNGVHAAVALAQLRTLTGSCLRVMRALLRDGYRMLTYSPIELWREHRRMEQALHDWDSGHLLLFPYVCVGGAERVHAAIGAAIKDRAPLTVIFGRSKDRGLEHLFCANGPVLEIPRLLHHPLTRRAAHRHLAQTVNRAQRPVVLASLSAVFFDLLPMLKGDARTIYLQHAFLHQPTGNAQWRRWLPLIPRIDALLFVSQHSMKEFERFLFANNIDRGSRAKLRFMPNAVDRFSAPKPHQEPGILFVGRDSEEKRLPLFIEVCERLHASQPGRFRFTMAGVGPRSTAAPISFLGPITDSAALGRVYQEHDLLLVTSDREGFPMAIMEAMAHGLAILSTPVGDVPNRTDSSFAMLSECVETEAAVNAFVDAAATLASDPDRLQRMRDAAHAKALAEFDPEAFAERYRALFLEMSGTA